MTSWLNKLSGWLFGRPPRLTCSTVVWQAGAAELRRRTLDGRRESGAFLLGVDDGKTRRIQEFVFYDDLDPNALATGIVHFDGRKFAKLWDICRARGFGVVADVHVHPGGFAQSESDRNEPAMPRAGHLAIIIPHFAMREVNPGGIGLYEYLGNKRWITRTEQGSDFFRLEGP